MRVAWPQLMQLGMRDLGLSPDNFWALTPAELMTLAGAEPGQGRSMTRDGFEALLRAYPDIHRKGGSDDGS